MGRPERPGPPGERGRAGPGDLPTRRSDPWRAGARASCGTGPPETNGRPGSRGRRQVRPIVLDCDAGFADCTALALAALIRTAATRGGEHRRWRQHRCGRRRGELRKRSARLCERGGLPVLAGIGRGAAGRYAGPGRGTVENLPAARGHHPEPRGPLRGRRDESADQASTCSASVPRAGRLDQGDRLLGRRVRGSRQRWPAPGRERVRRPGGCRCRVPIRARSRLSLSRWLCS